MDNYDDDFEYEEEDQNPFAMNNSSKAAAPQQPLPKQNV